MNTYPAFSVLLHHSVLERSYVRDTLLRTYAKGLYRAHFTDQSLEALHAAFCTRQGVSDSAAEVIVERIAELYPEAIVRSDECKPLIPDEDDASDEQCLVAAAMLCHAQVIVTMEPSKFQSTAFKPAVLEAQHPDIFLCNLADFDRQSVCQAVVEQAADLRRPPRSIMELLEKLGETVPDFAEAIRYLLPPYLASPS